VIPRAIHGRPRGFIDWQPQAKTAALIEEVREVLDEYGDYLPLTIRQIFYRLVGARGYEKTERAYDRLVEVLNKARRARLIDFDTIRDDGFYRTAWLGWRSLEQAQQSLIKHASSYRLDRQTGQPVRLAVWCEASGMAPQLERVCKRYSIPVYSSGGFDSLTVKHALAEEFAKVEAVLVLHIGDHDPSGVHVFGSLDEDVSAFSSELGGFVNFGRLAVTSEQIERYGLPTAPPKGSDRRAFVGETVQAEALPPDTLAEILEQAIMANLDMAIYPACR
jgi:hypothetical protein